MTRHQVPGGPALLMDNDMERHRCETFFTKEPETIRWLDECVGDGEVLYDIGANIGVYALYAALVHPGARVLAFEPYRPTFERLASNVRLNALDDRVSPLLMAASDSNAIATLFIKDERFGSSGHQLDEARDELGNDFEALGSQAVPTVRLDDFVAFFGAPRPNHVKIDVDGAESRVVQGMLGLLADESLRSVLVEINHHGGQGKALSELLVSNGLTMDNHFNRLENHSRNRRTDPWNRHVENVIFTR